MVFIYLSNTREISHQTTVLVGVSEKRWLILNEVMTAAWGYSWQVAPPSVNREVHWYLRER